MGELQLKEIMTADALTIAPNRTLAEAAGLMGSKKVGSIVVCEGDSVAGILTERDLVRAAAAGAISTVDKCERWMTAGPVTMSSDASLTDALDKMIDEHFRHVPVVDDGKLVGIVSFRQLIEAGKIRKVDPWAPESGKGLENVTIGTTELCHIDGAAGRYVYRGYDPVELAMKTTFTDVWHLLYRGELPLDDTFANTSAGLRTSPLTTATLKHIAEGSLSFMCALESAIAATAAAWGLVSWIDLDPKEVDDACLRLTSVIPTLVAALWRLTNGEQVVDPDPELSHAANYLYMLHGSKPTPDQVVACDRYLILTAEHGLNASTFTGRIIASTGADVGSAVTGAAGALSGPLHGGAPALVLDMLDDIVDPSRARSWITEAVDSGKRIMGFGHRVYKAEDPRSECLKRTAEELGSDRVELAKIVEDTTLDVLRAAKPGRALYTNVEFWSAVVLERAGIPRKLFTPTFAISRCAGWTAHILEQVADNRLIRPTATYVGPRDRKIRD